MSESYANVGLKEAYLNRPNKGVRIRTTDYVRSTDECIEFTIQYISPMLLTRNPECLRENASAGIYNIRSVKLSPSVLSNLNLKHLKFSGRSDVLLFQILTSSWFLHWTKLLISSKRKLRIKFKANSSQALTVSNGMHRTLNLLRDFFKVYNCTSPPSIQVSRFKLQWFETLKFVKPIWYFNNLKRLELS